MADPSNVTERLDALEARIEELERVQDVLIRLMATTRPLAGLLEQFGATESQEQALYRLLDDMSTRARGPEDNRPSLAFFQMRMNELFPERRGDSEFLRMVIDTLKVERPAYRALYDFMAQRGWAALA
jgi:hypothetical protein